MPTKKLLVDLSNFQSQASFRSVMFFYDQHRTEKFPLGRPWWANVEKAADGASMPMPCQELQPVTTDFQEQDGFVVRGWQAPWIPEAVYMMKSIGGRRGNHFEIRYDTMRAEYKEANDAYYKAAARIAAHKGWAMPQLYQAVDWQLVAVLGEPPKSPKIPEAAMAGDPWLLGLRGPEDGVNEQLEALLYSEDMRIAPPAKQIRQEAANVLTMTADELDDRIARAVAQAMNSAPKRGNNMEKARAAKAANQAKRMAASGMAPVGV